MVVGVVDTAAACATIVGDGQRVCTALDVYPGERLSSVKSGGENEEPEDGKLTRSVIL